MSEVRRIMGKTAFIFPGQGAQVCGMGQDFYENSETAKAVFDRATELLGFSVPELCFEKNDRLDITEYTQAAMVTTSVAMMKVMEERGIHADVAADEGFRRKGGKTRRSSWFKPWRVLCTGGSWRYDGG